MIYALVVFCGGCVVVSAGIVLVGLFELSKAVQAGMGDGQAADLKRQLKALEGRLEDAAESFDRRVKREDMRTRRESKSNGGNPWQQRLEALRQARGIIT